MTTNFDTFLHIASFCTGVLLLAPVKKELSGHTGAVAALSDAYESGQQNPQKCRRTKEKASNMIVMMKLQG